MLTSSVICDVISFCSKEMLRNPKNNKEKSSHLLDDLKNFSEIFVKNVTYDNIIKHKKAGFPPLSRKYIV